MTQNATEATAPVDIDARSAVNESFAKEADAASDSRSTVVDTSTNDVRASAALATPAGEPAMVSEEKTERSKAKVALIMSALGMAVFLAALDITIITTALPTISEHFHSTAGYTWIGSAYMLASAASMPLWGKISDIFGRKPILLLANFVFFIGSLIAGLAVSVGMLIVARAVQGIGGGGLVVLVNICIGDLFSMRSRGAYYGIIGGVWALASALGPVLGGAFTERVSWRWAFYINLPLDGAAFLIIMFFLDLHTPRTPLWDGLKAIDWTGALAVVGGTLMLLLGLQFGGEAHPWDSATTLCLIIFGAILLGLFFVNEWKLAKYPIMPLRIFSNRSNLAALGVCFSHGFVFVAASYFLPIYFQAVRGASPLLSGVYILPTALSLSFASAATGAVIRKTGKYLPPIYFGMFFMTLGFGLFIDLDAYSPWSKIVIYQIIGGLGAGPLFQSPLIALQSHTKPSDIATATAAFGFIRQLATATSVVVGAVVYQNEMKTHAARLVAALGPENASRLGGANAAANVDLVKALPDEPRRIARETFAASLSRMWILYVCFAVVGLLVSFLIASNKLTRQHEETKTGLETERARRAELQEEKRARKAAKDKDVEAIAGHSSGEKSTAPTSST